MAYDSVDYSGLINDAQQQRDQAKMRFMALAQARANYNKSMNDQYQAQMKAAQDADLAGNTNLLGKAGSGALAGYTSSGSPWGALAGGLVGLGEGAVESWNAQKKAGKSNSQILLGDGPWYEKALNLMGGPGSPLSTAITGLTGAFGKSKNSGLIGDVMGGGVGSAATQMRQGRLNQASFIPGTKYTATAGMLGGLAGGLAGKKFGPSTAKALDFSSQELQQANEAPWGTAGGGGVSNSVYPMTQSSISAGELSKPDISGFYQDPYGVGDYSLTDFSDPNYRLNYRGR